MARRHRKKYEFDPLDSTSVNNHGVIIRPGKFEGEMWWVPELWNLVMDGASDGTLYDGETQIDVFHVDAKMRREFGIIRDVDYVVMWESDQGFVNTKQLTTREYDALEKELESSGEDEGY